MDDRSPDPGCTRRAVLGGLAASLAPVPRWRALEHAAPDLKDPRILRFVAGIRPFRSGAIRLERGKLGDKQLVHNYGHGGCGVTLSWGSAECAADLVRAARGDRESGRVAVLGAGAVGMATARVLQERGVPVRVYAADFSPNTTSNVAGAAWLPVTVGTGRNAGERARYREVVRGSRRRFDALIGDEWGVRRFTAYATNASDRSFSFYKSFDLDPKRLDDTPIDGLSGPSIAYDTLLIEPPIYLAKLMREILVAGGHFVPRMFASKADVAALEESVVVNCMGFGSGGVFDDPRLTGIRGQLAHLFPQPLDYLLSHGNSYMFARSDALVIGGTHERGVTDPTPVDATCKALVASLRRRWR